MSKIDLEISIRSSDLVFARINLNVYWFGFVLNKDYLKRKKKKKKSGLLGRAGQWALLPAGLYYLQVPC